MSGIPIASYGRQAAMAEGVREKLAPEYDVVHISLDLESAQAELPALAGGNLEASNKAGLGTNAGKAAGDRRVPKAIFFSAQVPSDEFEAVTAAVKAASPDTACFQILPAELKAAGGTGPNVEVFIKVLKEKLAALSL